MSEQRDWCFPYRILENDRLKLEAFDKAKYAGPFIEGCKAMQDPWAHIFAGPFDSGDEFIDGLVKERFDQSSVNILYAILVKPQPGSASQEPKLAGIVSFLDSSISNACTEIGFIVVLQPYQRTFVTSNTVGLMLNYALDPPSQGGLGLRRVEWQTNSLNEASARTAKRMGFTFECVKRWHRTMPLGKEGNGVNPDKMRAAERIGGEKQLPGRHTITLAMCWDDWLEDGKREHVARMMER